MRLIATQILIDDVPTVQVADKSAGSDEGGHSIDTSRAVGRTPPSEPTADLGEAEQVKIEGEVPVNAAVEAACRGETECSVCSEEWDRTNGRAMTACKHVFCRPCMDLWRSRGDHTTPSECPYCRGAIAHDLSEEPSSAAASKDSPVSVVATAEASAGPALSTPSGPAFGSASVHAAATSNGTETQLLLHRVQKTIDAKLQQCRHRRAEYGDPQTRQDLLDAIQDIVKEVEDDMKRLFELEPSVPNEVQTLFRNDLEYNIVENAPYKQEEWDHIRINNMTTKFIGDTTVWHLVLRHCTGWLLLYF